MTISQKTTAPITQTLFQVFILILVLLIFLIPQKIKAQNKRVESIQIIYENITQLNNASFINFGVIKKMKKGKTLKTKGFAGGKEGWDDIQFEVQGGYANNGTLYVHSDTRKIKNHQVKLKVWLNDNPQRADSVIFKLNYEGETLASFKPNTPPPPDDRGGRILPIKIGGSGSDGKEGYKGEDGYPGDIVDVYVKLESDSLLNTSLLKVYTKNRIGNREGRFLVHPEKGFISILAEGGNGANGGNGGRGVDGKDRSDKNRQGGDGSNGGRGGDGGNGGNGGTVTLYVDPSAEAFIEKIRIYNAGGQGGYGGYGGRGGDGGGGNPPGNSGSTGDNGLNGTEGMNGPQPQIIIQKVELDF
jgi:hypothetical protein